jgi:hypothetical protein
MPNGLFQLLQFLIGKIKLCSRHPKRERLDCLRNSLTSPRARLENQLGHLKDKVAAYLKRHPARVVVTTVSFVLALTSGHILPLAPGVVTLLRAVKDASSSEPKPS